MVFEGSSLEEVKKRIERDIYYTTGVVCVLHIYGRPFRLSDARYLFAVAIEVGRRAHRYPSLRRAAFR